MGNPILNIWDSESQKYIPIPAIQGAPGKDGAGMDVTGATVGQIVQVAAVDEAGKPTEWVPVDMPSGGSDEKWVKIADLTVEEDCESITITQTDAGEDFRFREVYMYMGCISAEESKTTALRFSFNGTLCSFGSTAGLGITAPCGGTTGRIWLHVQSLNPLIVLHGSNLETNTQSEKTVLCWQPAIESYGRMSESSVVKQNPFSADELISAIGVQHGSSSSIIAAGSRFIFWGRRT